MELLNSNMNPHFTILYGSATCEKDIWTKSNKDIVVSESGAYVLNFPFVRNQGGVDTTFMTQIAISSENTLSQNVNPNISCVAMNWSVVSMTYTCELQAGKTYHIFLRHLASQTHIIDYHCHYAKL